MSARKTTPPAFVHGIGTALVLSLSGAAMLAALTPLAGASTALRVVVALLGFAYVLYVLAHSGERVGRAVTVVAWVVAAAVAWLSGVPLTGYVLIHAGTLWLVRSLYFYCGLLPALADLALSALGIAFAVWGAGHSGSALLAFWCFFLIQALHVVIPATIGDHGSKPAADPNRAFDRAHRAAEAALRRLAATR